MNTKNLPLKFAFLGIIVAAAIIILKYQGLKLGIDLRGGHSMIFEIRTGEREADDLRAMLATQEEALRNARTDDERKKAQEAVNGINDQLKAIKGAEDQKDLPERIIAILKKRIDPMGQLSLEWRPMGRKRIQVRMPAAN
jgi:preprotein translocase subunit SecF